MKKEYLKDYASKLMFNMKEEEYDTLLSEFDIISKQITMMEEIDNISNIEPMSFPFITYKAKLRKDEERNSLEIDEVLKNTSSSYLDQIKVPKVVE